MAKIIRYSVIKETHSGENNFLIHRPYILSNPFTHIKDKKTKAICVVPTREKAVEMYDKYFDTMLEKSDKFRDEFDRVYEVYKKFDTIYLGCYCNESESCHGDIIAEKLKRRSIKEMMEQVMKRRES